MNLMLFARQLPSLQLLMVHTVALCDCRFQDKEGINLLSILDTSDLESVPRMHGLLQMEQLADQYQMDSDDLATEWKSLLDQLTDTAANDRTLPSVYKLLHTEGIGHAAQFPLLTRLYAVAIALPVSTAGVERVFSQLKLMKTAHRNRLKEQTLQMLLRLKINCKPELFVTCLPRAAKAWLHAKARRFAV